MRRARRGNVRIHERHQLRDDERGLRTATRMLLLRVTRAYVHAPCYLRRYCWASLLLVLRRAFTRPSSYDKLLAYLRRLVRASGWRDLTRVLAWRALRDALVSHFHNNVR